MPVVNKTPPSTTDMQKWEDVFYKGTSPHIYDTKENKWNSKLSFIPGQGKISKFKES